MKVRKQHLTVALWLLAAAVVWTLWSNFQPVPRQAGPPALPLLDATQSQPGQVQAAGVDPMTLPAPLSIDTVNGPSWARDPFLFGDESRTTVVSTRPAFTQDPTVRSILVSSTRRVALVGNRMVSVGDAVGTMRVVAIDPGAVVFTTAAGERRRVPVHGAQSSGIRR